METERAAVTAHTMAEWRDGTRDTDSFSVDHDVVKEFTDSMFDGRG